MKNINSQIILILLFFVGFTSVSVAQQTAEKFGDVTGYLLHLPKGYEDEPTKQWPLMIFLHGVGECGNDVEKVKLLGPPAMIERGHQYPFIVVSPQSPQRGWDPEMLYGLIADLKQRLRIDEDRVYLTGLSMGGFGTWTTAQRYPGLFAAIIPICGGGQPDEAWRITMPVWCFHGDQDESVSISYSQKMIDALEGINPDVKFTVYPGVGHDSWTETYNNEAVYEWMLSHTRRKLEKITLNPVVLKEYVGRYDLGEHILSVTIREDGLYLEVGDTEEKLFVFPVEKDKFLSDPYLITDYFLFERDQHNKVHQFSIVAGPHKAAYKKIK